MHEDPFGVLEFARHLPVMYFTGPTREGKASLMTVITEKQVSKMDSVEVLDELDELHEREAVLRDHLNALESAGFDEYADGTVIRFTKPMMIRGIVRTLTYVAIKKADAWFVTGASGPNEIDWKTLVLWAGPDNIASREIVKEWESR